MLSKLSNFPDKLSENDELREYELSRSDCITDVNEIITIARAIPRISNPL